VQKSQLLEHALWCTGTAIAADSRHQRPNAWPPLKKKMKKSAISRSGNQRTMLATL